MFNNPFQDGDRMNGRRAVNATGAVILGAGEPLACTILNVSAGGAQLEIAAEVELPATFEITTDAAFRRPVEVVWQEGNRVGVRWAKP